MINMVILTASSGPVSIVQSEQGNQVSVPSTHNEAIPPVSPTNKTAVGFNSDKSSQNVDLRAIGFIPDKSALPQTHS